MKNKKTKIKKLRTDFLPEALEIVERPVSPLGNIIIWLTFLLLILFVIWACVGKIDEVATARGQIVTDDGIFEVQASATGSVANINIEEGQSVQQGDVLYCLNQNLEQNVISYSEGQVGLLELKIELLDHLLGNESIDSYLYGDYSDEQLKVIEAMISMDATDRIVLDGYELAIKNARNQINQPLEESTKEKAQYLQEQQKLQKEADDVGSTLEIELDMLQNNYQYHLAEAEKYEKLYNAGAKSKNEVEQKRLEVDNLISQIRMKEIEIENEKISEKINKNNIDYQIIENNSQFRAQQNMSELKEDDYNVAVSNLETAKQQRNQKLYEMRQQSIEEIKQYDVQLAEQYYQKESKEIIAQCDGVVKSVEVDKLGAVVTATQILAEILPDAEQLLIDVNVNNSDIAYIEIGQTVDVKVDTYNYQKYGKLNGVVTYISPDAFENEQHQKMYKIQIALSENSNQNLKLSTGMECTAEIKTGERHIIEFFLEPLIDALDEGMKER